MESYLDKEMREIIQRDEKITQLKRDISRFRQEYSIYFDADIEERKPASEKKSILDKLNQFSKK
jgi:hypothetical protein